MTHTTKTTPSTRWQRLVRLAIGLLATTLGVLAVGTSSRVAAGTPLPKEFDGVDVKNLLGQSIDGNIPLTDENGKKVLFSELFDGKRPVVLTLNYYRCTSLCSVQLNELLKALEKTGWVPGEKFRVVTVSFDPRDTVDVAHDKRLNYLREFARYTAKEDGDDEPTGTALDAKAEAIDWAFMVGSERAIKELTERIGYGYRFDEESGQYAHSPVTYIMSPKGVISRYLYGISYNPRDLKFGLMDASDGKIGSLGEKVLLSCFAYDADEGGYAAFAWGFLRLGGVLALLIFGSFLLMWWRRERRRSAADAAANTQNAKHAGHGVVTPESAR
ncbi:MAG: SCO family protein [Deltaproteobacteria bacterium]|nr:SCO family protein [Deltaproteobacteria bacterium]